MAVAAVRRVDPDPATLVGLYFTGLSGGGVVIGKSQYRSGAAVDATVADTPGVLAGFLDPRHAYVQTVSMLTVSVMRSGSGDVNAASVIAPEVGQSVPAVKRRIDRLRESGVITGFTVQMDHTKLGWGRGVHRGPLRGRDAGRRDRPQRDPLAGDPDALVRLRGRNIQHLQEVIDTLRGSARVTGTKTLMVRRCWTKQP